MYSIFVPCILSLHCDYALDDKLIPEEEYLLLYDENKLYLRFTMLNCTYVFH